MKPPKKGASTLSRLAEKLKPCRICGDKPFLFTCKDCIDGKQQPDNQTRVESEKTE